MDDIKVVPVPIKNILFVESAVLSLDPYINAETAVIGYNSETTTPDEMMQRFVSVKTDTVNRIGFAFHYSSSDPILFLNQEPFFTDSDLGEEQDLVLSQNVQFMLDLLFLAGGEITHIDFLACDTLQNEKWKQYYALLQLKTGVVVGASDNNTGNMKYGGDWIMESTLEEVAHIYFTSAIENWASLLVLPTGLNQYYHTFYTMNATTDPYTLKRTIYNNVGTLQETQDILFGDMLIVDVLSLLDGGGTNPYTIGVVDSFLNKISMDTAYAGVYTKALTTMQQTKLMTYVNTTFKEPHTAVELSNTYVVTISGDMFWLAGNNGAATTVSYPSLLLTYGKSYIFDQSHSSNTGKPLTINTNITNTIRYTAGVVTNGTPGSMNSYTLIDLSSSVAGATLYYGMNGTSGGSIITQFNEYAVTVVNSKYAINGVQLDPITFLPSKTYVFTQTDGNFATYPVKFSRTPDGTAIALGSDTQWSLSVVGTTTILVLNSSFTGVLYYFSSALTYMGYGPPTISVNTVSAVAQNGTFVYTIKNRTNAPIAYGFTGSTVTNYNLLFSDLNLASSLSGSALAGQETTVSCINKASIYQILSCTLTGVSPVTVTLTGPPATVAVSSGAILAQNDLFTFTVKNTTSAPVTFSVTGSVVTGYLLTYGQLFTGTATTGVTLSAITAAVGDTIVYCKNTALIYQTVVCKIDGGVIQNSAVLAGPPATVAVSSGATLAQNALFTFTVKNTTSAPVAFSITGSVVTGYLLAYGQLFTGTATTGVTLNAITAAVGDTIVYCKNTALIYQTVVCKIDGGVIQNSAVLAGPPATVAVSPASSAGSPIASEGSFTFTISNTTSAPITFSMTSTQAITAAQLYTGLSSAYTLVAQSVQIGTTIIYCKNQVTSLQTVTCTVNSGANPTQTAVLAAGMPVVMNVDALSGNYTNTSSYPITTTVSTTGSGTVSISSSTIKFSANKQLIYSNPTTTSSPLALGTRDFEITVTAKYGSGYWLRSGTASTPGFGIYIGSGQTQFHCFFYQNDNYTRLDWQSAGLVTNEDYTFICTRDESGLSCTSNTSSCTLNYIESATGSFNQTGAPENAYPNATFVRDANNRITKVTPVIRADFGNVNSSVLTVKGDASMYVKVIKIKNSQP